jgi:hypothetical protein
MQCVGRTNAIFASVLGVALAAGGCHSDREPPAPSDPSARVLHGDPRNATRRLTFGDLPAPVREAFREDHPRATFTDAGVTTTEVGPALYRVVYKQDGLPGEATYGPDGSRIDANTASALSHPNIPPPTTGPVVVPGTVPSRP